MASGTVGYTDTRSENNYLASIAKSIGNRLKQASNMASEERAYAAGKAEAGGTSLEEAGIGKGYFFKRALGSRFGGDRIARTRGRFESDPPAGRDPTKNYKQRFRGGFDYKVTNQINELTSNAIVPMSSAIATGMRQVQVSVDGVSSALVQISNSMNNLATAQQDLARQAMMNGAFMRAFMTYMQRQQSRTGASREERLLEGGRRRLGGGGGRGPINITPGSGGGGGGLAGSGGGFSSNFFDTTQTVVKSAGQAKKAVSAAGSAISSGVKAASGGIDAGGALVKAGTSAAKFVPNGAKIGQSAAKLLKVPASELGKFFGSAVRGAKALPGIAQFRAMHQAMMEQSAAGMLGKGGFFSQLKNFITGGPDFLEGLDYFKSSYPSGPGRYSRLDAILAQQDTFDAMTRNGSSIVRSGNTIDVPINSSAADDLARQLGSADAQALAAARMAAGDRAGMKAAEMSTDAVIKKGTQQGLKKGSAIAKMMVKQFGAAGTKSILKKIPVIAGVAGILFGIQRAMEGDFLGAGLEITSGLLGATGVGAPLGLGIDGFLLARDLGMMPMAKGGILTQATPVVAGEAGAEGFFPLEGARGRKTFAMFGEGLLQAQKDSGSEYARIQALGHQEYYEGMGGWEKFFKGFGKVFDTLKDSLGNVMYNIFSNIPILKRFVTNPSTSGNGVGGADRPGATAGSNTLNIGGGGGQMNLSDEQYKWLAYAISGEAGPGDDQYAVAASILNRVAEGRGTVEQVVKAHGQYEAYEKGMMKMSPEIEARLKSAEGQARMVAALNRLQGRTDFKGQTQLQNRVAGEDPMVDKKGNFFHYSWQTGANSVRPSDYRMPNYQQFIKRANAPAAPLVPPPPVNEPNMFQKWLQSIGGGEQQSQQLNQSSAMASLAPFSLAAPTVINNNYYTQAGGSQTDDSFGAGFSAAGFSAYTVPFSLASKA